MKKTLVFLSILFCALTIFQICQSFGVFETKLDTDEEFDIATWNICVNDSDITGENKVFRVSDITYKNEDGEEVSKFAPSTTGEFILVFDPKNTEVSFKYELNASVSSVYSQISITSVQGINGTNLTLEDGSYFGVISLNDIKNGVKNYIKITFSWEDSEENNDSDSLIGTSLESLEIPISIKFTQQK